uniref:Intersectin-1 n=1 Tax=Meloidogyne incognita TaxID=6306 RepID=A0A914LH46_MELIC
MMILSNNSTSNSGNYPSTLMNVSGVQQQNPPNISPNPWVITAQEHRQNEGQFVVLRPIGGMIYGEQARPFFLKSGLSASALAQIWQLSDLNKDGKLDRLEFSIAMKLIRNCLAGLQLPSVLPDSMRQIIGDIPPQTGQFQFNGVENAVPAMQQPQMPPRPMSTYGISTSYRPSPPSGSYSAAQTPTMPPATFGAGLPFHMGTKEMGDWSLPQPLKLRFCQQFNQLDRSRIGLLTGQQARGVLAESLLPTHVLAQIWNMSDVNKDGCLGIEEFCTAQFLIEMIKSGYALPSKLPNELYAFCSRSKTVSPSTVLTQNDPDAPPPQKAGSGGGHFKTFEDKRRDNLDKGQAELDRRRQILRAEEERRRAEIERREREEAERKERERQEYERRREAELEIQRRRELELEKERAAEEERMKAQREEARRRLEIERIKELEKIRVRDLENQLDAETEKATQIQQRHRTISFQIQALDERSQQLNGDVTGVRDKILEITQEIEGMRELRDEKCAKIQELERKTKELTVQSERYSHENLQLQAECQRYLGKSNEIDSIQKESTSVEEEIKRLEDETQALGVRTVNQEKLVLEKRPDYEKSCADFETLHLEHKTLLARYNKVRVEKYPETQIQPSIATPKHYEVPPDSARERKASKDSNASGFDDDFVSVFGNAATTSKSGEKQNMLDGQLQNSQHDNAGKSSIQQRQDSIPGAQQDASHILLSATAAGLKTIKYKALYEFVARSNDELSLQPGDIILVFEGYQSEPGWLAGQIRDKVGWFPAAFAEPVNIQLPANSALKKGNALSGSPSTEPLASIQEEGSEFTSVIASDKQQTALFTADFTSAFSKSISLTDTTNGGVAAANSLLSTSHSTNASFASFSAGACYDLPPCDEKSNNKSLPLYEVPPSDEPVKGGDVNILGTGIALYQWKARNEQEMTFGRGDIIEVLEQGELRWRGRLQKNKQINGWFPKSYIKLGATSLSAIGGNGVMTTNSKIPNQINAENVDNVIGKMTNSAIDGKSSGEWFIALYQFDAVEPTDLSLKAGDRIWVIDQREQWWRGTCEGRTGIFPANYVQKALAATGATPIVNPVKEKQTVGRAIAAFEATASNQISLHLGDIVRVHQITPGGWWEGELERNGEKHIGWFPGNYLQVISEHKNDAETKSIAIAAFDYQAQHNDELSFKAGDVIEVLDNSDAQWWRGRKQGDEQQQQQLLLFPANFVQLR